MRYLLLNHSRKRKIRQLREELENSVKSTTGHRAELEETRERLADAEAELKRYEQLVKKNREEKRRGTNKAGERNQEKMDPAPVMRAALQVENLLQMIAGVTAEFKDILDKYAAAYEASDGEEVTALKSTEKNTSN